MDQSAKPGEKWRRRRWTRPIPDKAELYISPAGKPGEGWILYGTPTPVKMDFVDHELSADDWEKFE